MQSKRAPSTGPPTLMAVGSSIMNAWAVAAVTGVTKEAGNTSRSALCSSLLDRSPAKVGGCCLVGGWVGGGCCVWCGREVAGQ